MKSNRLGGLPSLKNLSCFQARFSMSNSRIIQNQQFGGGHTGLSALTVPLLLMTQYSSQASKLLKRSS